jgi:hypothetical protein
MPPKHIEREAVPPLNLKKNQRIESAEVEADPPESGTLVGVSSNTGAVVDHFEADTSADLRQASNNTAEVALDRSEPLPSSLSGAPRWKIKKKKTLST